MVSTRPVIENGAQRSARLMKLYLSLKESFRSMVETTLTIRHRLGLHARPAVKFVQTAAGFKSKIEIINLTRQSKNVDAKSIIGVLSLSVAQNHEIALTIDGPDEEAAMLALTALVEDNFGDYGSEC